MDAKKIGEFISKMRKTKNLTQTELAEKLKVSNKAVSKWETGKGMPDISMLKPLSQILDVSINELLNGEEGSKNPNTVQSDTNIRALVEIIEKLKKRKNLVIGILIFVFGLILIGVSNIEATSDFSNFISGLATGLSVGAMIIGIIIVVYYLVKSEK